MRSKPNVVIFHYCPFVFGAHGVPIIAPFLPLAARIFGVRVTTVFHELFYPWGHGGWRGILWSVSQRAACLPVVLGSISFVVTSPDRKILLEQFPGIGRKPVKFIPVWSAIPVASNTNNPTDLQDGSPIILGSFGWGNPRADPEIVMEAMALLLQGGIRVHFLLIGSPGRNSDQGRRWVAAARKASLGNNLEFTGAGVPKEKVSAHLSSLEIYIHLDPTGPQPRRSSLAAALAHSKPIISFSGPKGWPGLKDGRDLVLCEPTGSALAETISKLLSSRELKDAISRGALQTYQSQLAVEKRAASLLNFVLAVPERGST